MVQVVHWDKTELQSLHIETSGSQNCPGVVVHSALVVHVDMLRIKTMSISSIYPFYMILRINEVYLIML